MIQPFRKNFYSFLALLAACFQASPARAGNPNDYLSTRTYLGILGTSVSVDSSSLFSGKNYTRADLPKYEIDLIPKLDQSFGFGLMVGHREDAYAMEVSYWQSNHTASFGPGPISSQLSTVDFPLTQSTAVLHSVNLDFKRYFLTELQSQPFINLGVSFPWIEIPDGAEDGNGHYSQLNLAGLGLNLGIGLEYYLTPNFSISAAATQRWASFDQFKSFDPIYSALAPYGGVSSDGGSGLDFTIGTTIGFQ